MPIYWGDLIADTLHLSRSDFGSYMLLIGAYWKRGSALPDDDDALRSISRCHTDEWKRSRVVLQAFFRVANGLWTHKRIERELLLAKENQQKNLDRTKAATEARLRRYDGNVTKHVTNNVTFTPSPSPSPSPIPLPTPTPSVVGANESHQQRLIASSCDSEWIASLSANEAYSGIDIKRELAKMNTWCATNQKRPSRKRFIAWLNRCEVPMAINGVAIKPSNGPTLRDVQSYSREKFADIPQSSSWAASFHAQWSKRNWRRHDLLIDWKVEFSAQAAKWKAQLQ